MIEFGAQRANTGIDFVVADQRPFKIELFRSKREPAAIIVSVRCLAGPNSRAFSSRSDAATSFCAPLEFKPIIRFAGADEIVGRAPLG